MVLLLLAVCVLLAVGEAGRGSGGQAQTRGKGMARAAGAGMPSGIPGSGGMDVPPAISPGLPPASVAAADGVVYVVSEGRLIAFDAKTLERIGETSYLPRPGAM